MLNRKKRLAVGLMVGLMSLMATPAFAKSISLKEAGVTLWIFIIIGGLIVLLQLVPAAILFFSFIGTTSSMVFKRKKPAEGAESRDDILLPGYKPATVKK
jgi:hypothetical protein